MTTRSFWYAPAAWALLALGIARPAAADDPKYDYAKPPAEEIKTTTWRASAQAGFVLTTGNSQTKTLSGGLTISRLEGRNKLQLDLTGAYVRSGVFIFTDTDGDKLVDTGEFKRESQTTAKGYLAKARYDRFFTDRNSLYVTGAFGADEPAGKDLFGGGQVGYSRLVLKTDVHEVTAEAGLDLTYEDLTIADSVTIFSGRAFLGYAGTLSKTTGLAASIEALVNLNSEDAAYQADGEIAVGEDVRLVGKTAVTTQLFTDISLRFGFALRFDNEPAPVGKIAGQDVDPTNPIIAEELDTITDVSLIVNFL
jgi:putative salt-induced outer membrane protein YdiY